MKVQCKSEKVKQELLKGLFGIEKESLRVDQEGWLADTPHPYFPEDNISRDFGESQLEFISDAWENLFDACRQVCGLQNKVEEYINQRESGVEYVWNYSNPPFFHGEDDIRIAEFVGEKSEKTDYREYLSDKYGKVKMLYSGVHFNYSASDDFFQELQRMYDVADIVEMKSKWYLELSHRLMNDSWLIVALTAASPVAEEDFLSSIFVPKEEYRKYASFRNSPYGYWNLFEPELSYSSFHSYCDSIEGYIKDESICSIQELYYPIRLKPPGDNTLEDLRKLGTQYIELRMLDLNPYACSGVETKDFIFIHLLIAFRMYEMLSDVDSSMVFPTDASRIILHKEAAKLDFLDENLNCKNYAMDLIENLEAFYASLQKDEGAFIPECYDIEGVLRFQKDKLIDRKKRYAVYFQEEYKEDFVATRMRQIRENS